MTKKGIVISIPFTSIPNGVKIESNIINPADVRKYLLYWDEIDYPDNNLISTGLYPDLAFLQKSGILKRTRIIFQGSYLINDTIFIKTQEQAFKNNEEQEPRKWSLAQLSDSQFYTNTLPKTGIEFELLNCLPVPQADVPLNDILEFKEKRNSELLAVRIYLNDLYQSIINSADIPRAKNAALGRLELSLKDLDKTMNESGMRKTLTSLRGSIGGNIAGALDDGLRASGATALYNISYALPAFSLVAAASFIIKLMLHPQNTGSNNPLTYIKSIKENFDS